MSNQTLHNIRAVIFLLPFFFYEEGLLAAIMAVAALLIIFSEKIMRYFIQLDWKEYLFFLYMFHMLFGERQFAYLGIEPLFVTEIFLGVLIFAYAKDLLQIRRVLFIYYLIVLIGLGFTFVYFFQFKLDAVRDSFMLLYAFWVPVVYHVFRGKNHYDFFFALLKIFIVLKAVAYCYEAVMILQGNRTITFEGFRFGVGYIMPSMIVLSIFLPFRHISWKYKVVALLMVPAVFTVFHRSIFLGLILGVVVIFIIGGQVSRKNIVLYGASSLTVLIGFLIYYNTIVEVDIFRILEIKSSLDEGNINYRVLSWQHVLDKFYEHFLIGYGVGRPVMFAYQNVFYSTVELTYFQIRDLAGNAQPHNSYLNVLTRFGILVFPLFLYAIFQPLFRIRYFAQKKKDTSSHDYSKYLLLIGFLMLMYVLAFFNVVLEGPHHSFPFWLVIGMLLSFDRAGNLSPKFIQIKKTEYRYK
ncbi:MAG: O-antigen ligase family protein [Balneolaceae bacterium]|nr:O-antigen ligase family protein [Balneolaceae bacterium]